jgi:hypothetical protein
MKAKNPQQKIGLYRLLLALQIMGAFTFIWQELPEFRQVASNPGEQIPRDDLSDLLLVGFRLVMQGAFWCRMRLIPMPVFRPNAFLQHLFLFLGKLSSSSAAPCSASPCSGTFPNSIMASIFS